MHRSIGMIFGCLLAVMGLGCCTNNQKSSAGRKRVILQVDTTLLRDGDILFRMGLEGASRVVTTVGGGDYSHVGMAFHSPEGWQVIHAVPDEAPAGEPDLVKCEPVASFFSPERARSGAVTRVSCDDSQAADAVNWAYRQYENRIPFDHRYDLDDTTRLYCTELVWLAYRSVGIDLAEGRRHQLILPGKAGWFIFPCDLWDCKDIKKIHSLDTLRVE